MMSQKKFYISIILGLVSLNMILLAFFLLTKPRPRHHPPPRKFQFELIEKLRLDEQQTTAFNALVDEHKLQMNAINERQGKLLKPYFERLVDASKGIDADSLLSQFQQAEKEKIEITYQHLQEIKKILHKDQLIDFELLIDRITDRILSSKQKKTPPREGF
ncbi:MAG: hypothetical protein AAGG68_05985 [Bacteroidota bacterium]